MGSIQISWIFWFLPRNSHFIVVKRLLIFDSTRIHISRTNIQLNLTAGFELVGKKQDKNLIKMFELFLKMECYHSLCGLLKRQMHSAFDWTVCKATHRLHIELPSICSPRIALLGMIQKTWQRYVDLVR